VLVGDSPLDAIAAPDIVLVPGGPGTSAEPVAERVVVHGKVVTAAGVSSGIDMALTLAAREVGGTARMLQLAIEYDPQPPFDSGSVERADADTRDRATRYFAPATSS
jgi:transcriptional regulator GlxA family with amidase domain